MHDADGIAKNGRFDVAWIFTCAILSSVLAVTAASRSSATFDEPLYLELGLTHWRTGSSHGLMRVGTMPLPIDVVTLPIFVWEKVRGNPFDTRADIGVILPIARLGTLAFWWLLLFLGWKLACDLGGLWSGRVAVAILALEPNLLAHAGLATTDIALTACLLLFCWLFQRGRSGNWWVRVALPGIGYGIAMLAKASALAYAPLCAVVIELCSLASRHSRFGILPILRNVAIDLLTRHNVRDALQIFVLGSAVVYVYCGSDWKPEPTFIAWADSLPEGTVGDIARWCSRHLCIFNNAGVAFARQIKHNMQGHGAYLLGDVAPRSIWYYYPAALSIKLPLSLIVLPIALTSVKPKALMNLATMLALALLLFSLNCRVQIGIRLVLPIVVFLAIGSSTALARLIGSEIDERRRRIVIITSVLSLTWLTVATITTWPQYLNYSNEAWGGPRQTYRHLSDSNSDWGQGLLELSDWARRRPTDEICVWYFGADPRVEGPPFVHLPVHVLPIRDGTDLRNTLRGRMLAVSKTLLFGSYKFDARVLAILSWLRQQTPMAETSTFIIYAFSPQTISTQVAALPVHFSPKPLPRSRPRRKRPFGGIFDNVPPARNQRTSI